MKPADLAVAIFVVTIWGLNFVIVKIGLEDMPPFMFMTLRFAVVALLLFPFLRWAPGKMLHLLGYSFVLGCVHFTLMFNAIDQIDASTVALLSQLNTPFAVIVSALFFRDYPGWKRISGIIIAFTGCIIIAGEPRFDGELVFILMVVGGTFAWAISAAQVKWIGDMNPFVLNGWMALFATPQLLLMTLLMEENHWQTFTAISLNGIGAVLYQSVMVVIVGYGFWYGLLKRYPLSRVIPLTLLLPVIGVLGGTLFLGEPLTWAMVGGGVTILIGVGIVVLRQIQQETPSANESK